jgi:hypothetical protein
MSGTATRVQLNDIETLPDILSSEHFALNLGAVPGFGGDGRDLLLKCIDANIPGFSTESYEVPLHGVVRNFRGRKMYPRSLAVTYVEDSNMQTLNTLRVWMEQIVGANTNTSVGGIAQYSVSAVLTIFDQTGRVIDEVRFINLFIQDIPDVQVTGESSTAMRVTCTFKYDYVIYSGVTLRTPST